MPLFSVHGWGNPLPRVSRGVPKMFYSPEHARRQSERRAWELCIVPRWAKTSVRERVTRSVVSMVQWDWFADVKMYVMGVHGQYSVSGSNHYGVRLFERSQSFASNNLQISG